MHAVTQMDPLQRTRSVSSTARQALDCKIRDVVAFHQTDSPEFGEQRELGHAGICQPKTAGEVDVTDPRAVGRESSHSAVGNVRAVAEMEVVEGFSELGDGMDSTIS